MKRRHMKISMELFIQFFTTGETTRVIRGLPKNTKLIGFYYDSSKNMMDLCLESEKFRDIPEGSPSKNINCTFQNLTICEPCEDVE